jgi:hypothetical protein
MHTPDTDAGGHAGMCTIPWALISMGTPRSHAVEHAHHARTACAAHQPREQRPTAAGALARHALLHVRVLGDHLLILLELGPGDVPRMMVANQLPSQGLGRQSQG